MGQRGLATGSTWCAARVRAYRRSDRPRGACRFEPSCSGYALDALERRRLPVAAAMIAARLVRCSATRLRTAAVLLVLGGSMVVLTAGSAASDEVTGGCTGSINGRDATTLTRDDPLRLGEGGTLVATGDVPPELAAQNPQSLTTIEVELLAGVVGVTSEARVSNGPTYLSGEVDVDDYLDFGGGLYRVNVVNRGQGWNCEFTAYLELETDPLGSPVGIAAAGAVVVGGVGVVLAKGVRRSPSREWVDELIDPHDRAERDAALRSVRVDHPDARMVEESGYAPIGPPGCLAALALPLAVMPVFGAGGGAAGITPGSPRRVVWSSTVFKRGHAVGGLLAGLVLGLGASALLWQYAVWLLTVWTVVVLPVVVAALAAGYAWYGRRYRVRILVAAPGGSPPGTP